MPTNSNLKHLKPEFKLSPVSFLWEKQHNMIHVFIYRFDKPSLDVKHCVFNVLK